MQELEKVLEGIIEQLKAEGCIIDDAAGNRAEEIIRNYMPGKDTNVPTNDGCNLVGSEPEERGAITMTENEAIEAIYDKIETCEFYFAEHDRYPEWCEYEFVESLCVAIKALKDIQQYREIGTVEELKKAVKEEDVLKFYYCESEDDYYIGKRIENFYYALYGKTGFEWFMSRYLPWGEYVVKSSTLWKEHTYPSEPKEIPFFEWLQGFLKKYCGGTVEEIKQAIGILSLSENNIVETFHELNEYRKIGTVQECREAVEKQKVFCESAEKYADGKCVGYGKSEMDDEPCEMCKWCKSYVGFEEGEE